MKQLFFLAAAAAALTLTSCGDDDGGSGGPSAPTGTITADITYYDGGAAAPQEEAWSLPQVAATRFQGNLTLIATDQASGETFTLFVPDNGLGTYFSSVADPGDATVGWVPEEGSLTFISQGTEEPIPPYCVIELTEIDTVAKTLTGTFQAGLTEPSNSVSYVIFNDGEFNNVPYTTILPGGTSDNSMSFKLDGDPFAPVTIFAATTSFFGTNILTVTASDANQRVMSINMPAGVASGTTLDYSEVDLDQYGNVLFSDGTFVAFNGGTLTVTNHNTTSKTMQGTFSFTLGDLGGAATNTITEGSFDITYQ